MSLVLISHLMSCDCQELAHVELQFDEEGKLRSAPLPTSSSLDTQRDPQRESHGESPCFGLLAGTMVVLHALNSSELVA